MEERWQELVPKLQELLARGDYMAIKRLLSSMEPPDLAEMLDTTPPRTRVLLFRLLPKDLAIEVFEHLEGSVREELLDHFTDNEIAEIIEEMSDDDRTALFDELPAKTVKKLLLKLSPAERDIANELLNYPESSAGRIMTPEFVDLKEYMTAEEAVRRIRQQARKKETIYTCFVIDRERRLLGVVNLEDLIMAEPQTPVRAIMNPDPVCVRTDTDQEEVARIMAKYDLHTIPVVDKENRLVGIITFDDIMDVLEEETTEDFERMAGIQPIEEGYLDTGIFTLTRKRLPWLVICALMETVNSFVLQRYSIEIQSVVALAYFIPLLIDTGGNVGAQSATLMIRGMAVGEIDLRDLWRVFVREVFIALLLGGVLVVLVIARAFMLSTGPDIALVVALALVFVVLLGNLAGIVLPIIAKFFRVDPAVMSGPFITTIVDVCGLIIYFRIARFVLGPSL
ncbi:magnesium transporter [Acetomicrobium sp. S15 = DSM 107314]|uniref:magnesium transporter n=1 Tax=Acetomicrobium sp. S15 = DSM 107314 TaxID=2529858 RepID=UPI0018E11F3F|nr:magnesium transporter [Acetomicrobium sp. S15 = DSM 107314]